MRKRERGGRGGWGKKMRPPGQLVSNPYNYLRDEWGKHHVLLSPYTAFKVVFTIFLSDYELAKGISPHFFDP